MFNRRTERFQCGGIADLGLGIESCCQHPRAVRAEGTFQCVVEQSDRPRQQFTGGRVPHAHAVVHGNRCKLAAVRAKPKVADTQFMLHRRRQRLAGWRVP